MTVRPLDTPRNIDNKWRTGQTDQTSDDRSRFISPAVAAALLGVSPRTVVRYVNQGRLDGIILPSGWRRVSQDSVDAILGRAS